MSTTRVYNLGNLNLKVSPFLQNSGEMIRSVNVETDTVGAKKKRPGYTTYLTSLGTEVKTLFNWTKNTGTQFWNYAFAGGSLFYSQQGTGAWTICGNGTLTANEATLGHVSVHGTLLMVGDGTAVTRHSTDGTSFTNTTSAPLAASFVHYQDRVHALGSVALHWATTGTPTDWQSDSSSIDIPGGGAPLTAFKASDRIMIGKTSGDMYRFDGYSVFDLSTDLGPTTKSIPEVENFKFLMNRQGVFASSGGAPEIISNPVERQIYNDAGSGIVGTVFDTAPGIAYRYDVLYSVGTVTDNLTDETLARCILKYDYQLDEWGNWQFANRPTAFGTYVDTAGDKQLIFGDGTGQCYTFGGTNTTDNGSAIESIMEGVLSFGQPETDKKFNYLWAFGNPGCEAHVQVAIGSTFTKAKKRWMSLGEFNDGVAELRFPSGSEGKLLFWKVTDASLNTRFSFYGFSVDWEAIEGRK